MAVTEERLARLASRGQVIVEVFETGRRRKATFAIAVMQHDRIVAARTGTSLAQVLVDVERQLGLGESEGEP